LECHGPAYKSLHVTVRYKRLMGKSATVKKAQNGGKVIPFRPITNLTLLRENDEFTYNNIVYSVKAICDDGRVKCQLTWDDDASYVYLEETLVCKLVQQFNRK
jgi:hypothetical protein